MSTYVCPGCGWDPRLDDKDGCTCPTGDELARFAFTAGQLVRDGHSLEDVITAAHMGAETAHTLGGKYGGTS